jgi:hypothetical protein
MGDTIAADSIAAWALAYARRGIPVLPLSGKLPRIPKRLGGRGVHDATTDPELVRAWWRRWPNANIGLRCGVRFDVIDVDGEQGRRSLERFLAEHREPLIGGPRVRTGAGGWHLHVQPTGLPDHIGVLDHVDYRAADRYVVAPPSRHPTTKRRYQWVVGRGMDTPLGQVPAALLELLAPCRIEQPPRPSMRPATPGHPYGQRALLDETAAVATAPKGTRNQQLWRSARSLYRLVAGGVLDQEEVERALRDAAAQCGLLAEEPHATERTLRSARRIGMAQPRGIPLSPDRRRLPSATDVVAPEPSQAPLERQ